VRIGRRGLRVLVLLVLGCLAASMTPLPAAPRPVRRPPRAAPNPAPAPNPNPSCPLWTLGWWFAGDINYPDDTHVGAGTAFEKGWWLQNCGELAWTTAKAVRTDSSPYGPSTFGPAEIELKNAAPSEVFEVKAWMTAPSSPGTHRATYEVWANGVKLDNYFWVKIVVDPSGTHTLTVTKSGSGTVDSSPGGISCDPTCSASFTAYPPVTLGTHPAFGYVFRGWSGDSDCLDGSVTMDRDRTCHATFEQDTGTNYTLTVRKTGAGSGTVQGPGISCGRDCSEVFPGGATVGLSATPDSGSRFDGWGGDCDAAGGVVMDADRTCTASFGLGGPGADLQLTATPSVVSLNGQGWPANNPVTVNVTASCSGSCSGSLVLNVGESGGGGRFYLYETSAGGGCTLTDDDPGDRFSATWAVLHCPLAFSSAGSASFQLKLWIQPSAGGPLPVHATWQDLQRAAPVEVPTAQVHPVVFVHGILGAMPPQNLLIDSREKARAIFDPFLGHYWPILDTLLKMGYEWNRSLFGVAYDWRAPNEDSAAFLERVLAGKVIPRSRPPAVPYAAADARADLLVHSMGGLVARSYIQGDGWGDDVRKVIFAASPHKGFPFDYRTWEGMTWSNYVYNAPLPEPMPPVGGLVFTEIMDRLIWPTLVAKRYRPSVPELAACVVLGSIGLPPEITEFEGVLLAVKDPAPTIVGCPRELVERWAKDGDPSRGIGSLRQMLPTEDSPTYLFGPQFPFGPVVPDPWGHEVNGFLGDLNANVGRLVSRIGVGNIYVLAGDGAPQTDRWYGVLPPTPFSAQWTHGKVPWFGIQEQTAGDDLIPTISSTLDFSGLVALPPGNEQILDAAPDPGGARHSPLMHHDEVQRKWVPTFLADVELPFKTDWVVPALFWDQPKEILLVMSACPANVMVTDPLHRRLGYDPVSRTMLNEIPGSTHFSPDMEPQLLWIGDPRPGRYEVRVTGWNDVGTDPTYMVRADRVGIGGTVGEIVAVAGETAPLEEHTFDFDLVPNRPPTADAGPDETVAAGEDCVARVTLDGSRSSDPDGDTLYYTWESGFETVKGVHPTLSLPLGTHTIRLSVHDGKGQVARDSVVITVEDETPPTITVPARVVAEQTSLAGTPVTLPEPVVKDNCSLPSVSDDAPATFPLGETVVTYTAVDAAGNVSTATTTVVVRDTTAPVIRRLVASPSSLWPPNHKMVDVVVTPTVDDVCDVQPHCRIALVTSSEPVTGRGDDTRPDWLVTGDLGLELRAERTGAGSGRTYTITVQCADASGNSAPRNVVVVVPHDQGGGK
jgi:Ig-like domain from next to BRCA1 gene/PKD domain/Lecithin:cholesterol acyltransferase/HYR domain/Divergent InlB B-repeat domain